jgi:hypothetical protein
MVAALSMLTGAVWMMVIPPFEGPDELFFYNRARALAEHPERRENLFYRLAAPIVRAQPPASSAATPEYNPAFRFVSNERGEVNRFVHDRAVAAREHVRALVALRGLVVVLAAATAVAIYAIARLSAGDPALALLVAGLCTWIPQFSFMNAVVHPEAFTRLLAAAITLGIVARATGRLPRAAAWVLLPLGIALVPFADRQALFLVPFAALALVVTERTWRARAIAALLVVAPASAAFWILTRFTEQDTDFGPWLRLVVHPLRPFLEADPGRGSIPPDAPYYAFEFLPKIFMGFWGWMGQPSVLLPASAYAALAVATALACAGLLLRLRHPPPASDEERRRRTARRLMAAGIALMCLPIIYGPAVAGRNLWYGRWLFAMVGPIVLGLVLGLRELVEAVRRSPDRVSLALAATAAVATMAWLTAPGDALRAAIVANHYGDSRRLVATVRDTIVALAGAAILIALASRLRAPRFRLRTAPALLVAAGVMNLVVLTGMLRPLYAPLDPDEYIGLISKYIAEHDMARAADLHASAIRSYPVSREIRRLADDNPRLLLGGSSASSRALLWDRIARGKGLDDRDALLMLAQEMRGRSAEWRNSEPLAAALAAAERRPDLAEAAALVRLAIADAFADRNAARTPIELGHGTRLDAAANNDVLFEGFTVHPAPRGGTQVILYFRARGDSTNSRLWMHAYRGGAADEYLDIEPSIVPAAWPSGELVWAAFDVPAGRYDAFIGVWVGAQSGRGIPIGVIP